MSKHLNDYQYVGDDPQSFLFAPRSGHASIKRPYRGIQESFFDGWVYPTLGDLYMEFEAPHTDWEKDAFMKAGWLK